MKKKRISYTEIHPLNNFNTEDIIAHAIEEFGYLGLHRKKTDCEILIKSLIGKPSHLEISVQVIVPAVL